MPYRQMGAAFRLIVTAEFALGSRACVLPMLLDTGADNLVLPLYAMDLLGLTAAECEAESANTLHGRQDAYRSPSLRIGFPDLWDDRAFETPVLFTPWLDNRAYGLLGREPTLDHLSCRFGHQSGYGFFLCFE